MSVQNLEATPPKATQAPPDDESLTPEQESAVWAEAVSNAKSLVRDDDGTLPGPIPPGVDSQEDPDTSKGEQSKEDGDNIAPEGEGPEDSDAGASSEEEDTSSDDHLASDQSDGTDEEDSPGYWKQQAEIAEKRRRDTQSEFTRMREQIKEFEAKLEAQQKDSPDSGAPEDDEEIDEELEAQAEELMTDSPEIAYLIRKEAKKIADSLVKKELGGLQKKQQEQSEQSHKQQVMEEFKAGVTKVYPDAIDIVQSSDYADFEARHPNWVSEQLNSYADNDPTGMIKVLDRYKEEMGQATPRKSGSQKTADKKRRMAAATSAPSGKQRHHLEPSSDNKSEEDIFKEASAFFGARLDKRGDL